MKTSHIIFFPLLFLSPLCFDSMLYVLVEHSQRFKRPIKSANISITNVFQCLTQAQKVLKRGNKGGIGICYSFLSQFDLFEKNDFMWIL